MPTPPEYDVAGKVFVAIGAGRGIGRGIVEVLAEAGAEGAVAALTPAHVLPMAEQMTARTGRRVTGIVADGTSGSAMDGVVEQVLREFGRIDVWVNAVGDSIRTPLVPLPGPDGGHAPEEPLSDEAVRRVLDINLTAMIVGCRAIGGYFVEQRRGRVINIGGAAGLRGGAAVSVYAAAKAAVEGLTRALALEWAPFGVTVNCISPGFFPDLETLPPDQLGRLQELGGRVPLRRVGALREVGLLAYYLASDAAAYMTGQTLHLDGGSTL